jgi:hypothetical protein
VEEAIARYLGVFVPFIATLVCAHYILRTSASNLLARTELASPRTFRRTLLATVVAFSLIAAVDAATDGDLFLRPRFPESQLLITLIIVAVFLVFTIGRSLAPIARRLKLIV